MLVKVLLRVLVKVKVQVEGNFMCRCPITIKNPYYGLGDKGLNFLHNTHDTHIQVPCGHCQQCVSMRQGFVGQRIQMESLNHDLFFFTLTYNNENLPTVTKGDYTLNYPDYTHIQKMFKRIRKIVSYPISYFVVSEYGTKRGRPHFHGILSIPKEKIYGLFHPKEKEIFELLKSEWRVNVGSNRSPVYESLFTYVHNSRNRNYDCHYIQPIPGHDNDISFYVSKYIVKYDPRVTKLLSKIKLDPSLDESDTAELISLVKPRGVMSKSFGSWKDPDVAAYIKKCIARNENIPQFYDIYTGKPMLLSPYYRKHFLTVDYRLTQYYNLSNSQCLDSFLPDDDLSDYERMLEEQSNYGKEEKFELIRNKMFEKFV